VIDYKRHVLDNGLTIIIQEDNGTSQAALNMLYNVGSRDEEESKSGLAHLFEHLMFNGTRLVDDFDYQMQLAGGDSNAFTNNDITNFYEILPAENIESAIWLEADRMKYLHIDENKFERERNVVIEEFKETCLTPPYGYVWHHLSSLAYKVHPYRWPTIGKSIDDLRNLNIDDARSFYELNFCPSNAILAITGNVNSGQVLETCNRFFGDINVGSRNVHELTKEPLQSGYREYIYSSEIPLESFYMVFHMAERDSLNYYTADLLSDILGNGKSSRLYKSLVVEEPVLAEIDAYVTGSLDPGLLVIEGKVHPGREIEETISKIWDNIDLLKSAHISERELIKYLNKVESNMVFSEINLLSRAMSMSYYELLGNVDLVNSEINLYKQVNTEKIRQSAEKVLTKENCSLLIYKKNGK
jgi:predicted Zn-dependent peptidase